MKEHLKSYITDTAREDIIATIKECVWKHDSPDKITDIFHYIRMLERDRDILLESIEELGKDK